MFQLELRVVKASGEDEPINFVLYSYSKAGNNQSIDLELDTDNDGVQDYLEDYFGTDKNKLIQMEMVYLIL